MSLRRRAGLAVIGLVFGVASAAVMDVQSAWRFGIGTFLAIVAYECYCAAGILRHLNS